MSCEGLPSVGPGRRSRQAERNLCWPSHFCILRRGDKRRKQALRQWSVVGTPISSVVPSSVRRAVVHSETTQLLPFGRVSSVAAWPLLAAQKASNP
jgi:hypothetical protein